MYFITDMSNAYRLAELTCIADTQSASEGMQSSLHVPCKHRQVLYGPMVRVTTEQIGMMQFGMMTI